MGISFTTMTNLQEYTVWRKMDWETDKKELSGEIQGNMEKECGRGRRKRQEREGEVEEKSARIIRRRRRSGSNGVMGLVGLREERQDAVGVLSPSSSLPLSRTFLWVVLLGCITEKWQRQICSLQPLLATNEFRAAPKWTLHRALTSPLAEKKPAKPDLWSSFMALKPNSSNTASSKHHCCSKLPTSGCPWTATLHRIELQSYQC